MWFIILPLIGCTGCSDSPTNGDHVEHGEPLLRHPQQSGPYVYYQDVGGYGRINGIYRINLADSVPRAELLLDRALFPAVSPSGARLAYVKGGLYIMNLETRQSEFIGSGDVLLPKWYGEDSLLYEVFAGKIYVVDVNVKEPVLVYDGLGSLLDIAASGMLALVDGNSISAVELPDSETVELFAYPDPQEFVADGEWSPAEDAVVFEYWRGSDRWIRIVTIRDSTTDVRTLASNGKYPSFSEDGRHILYVFIDPERRREFNGQIWIMDAQDGSDKKPLTTWEMMRD
jgi:Tol biopolymer transport system component